MSTRDETVLLTVDQVARRIKFSTHTIGKWTSQRLAGWPQPIPYGPQRERRWRKVDIADRVLCRVLSRLSGGRDHQRGQFRCYSLRLPQTQSSTIHLLAFGVQTMRCIGKAVGLGLAMVTACGTTAQAQSSLEEFRVCSATLRGLTNSGIDQVIFACSKLIGDQTLPADIRGQAHIRRGLLYDGDSRGMADFNEAVRLKANDAEAFLIRGYFRGFGERGPKDHGGAIADFTEAIRLNPTGPGGYVFRAVANTFGKNQRGDFRERKSEHEPVLADITKAIELPDSAVSPNLLFITPSLGAFKSWRLGAFSLRAGIYEMIGERERAVTDLRQALLLDPASKQIMDDLKRLGAQ